jgi:hypothetical protein
MTISIDRSTSGFRKWLEAQKLKEREKTRESVGESGGAAVPVVGHEVVAPDETPHRPWLVPGAGRV